MSEVLCEAHYAFEERFCCYSGMVRPTDWTVVMAKIICHSQIPRRGEEVGGRSHGGGGPQGKDQDAEAEGGGGNVGKSLNCHFHEKEWTRQGKQV